MKAGESPLQAKQFAIRMEMKNADLNSGRHFVFIGLATRRFTSCCESQPEQRPDVRLARGTASS